MISFFPYLFLMSLTGHVYNQIFLKVTVVANDPKRLFAPKTGTKAEDLLLIFLKTNGCTCTEKKTCIMAILRLQTFWWSFVVAIEIGETAFLIFLQKFQELVLVNFSLFLGLAFSSWNQNIMIDIRTKKKTWSYPNTSY